MATQPHNQKFARRLEVDARAFHAQYLEDIDTRSEEWARGSCWQCALLYVLYGGW